MMRKQLTLALFVILFSIFTPLSAISVPSEQSNTIQIKINGLVCDFCATSIEKVFKKKPEVKDINVNLSTKLILIEFHNGKTLSNDVLTKAINDSGYDVVAIQRNSE